MAVVLGFHCDAVSCDLARRGVRRGEAARETYPGRNARNELEWVWPMEDNAVGLTSILHRRQHSSDRAVSSRMSDDCPLEGTVKDKGKGSPYSITERSVPELIPVLCSQPAGDVSHKPGGRLPLLPARPAVTLATHKRAATSFAAW